MCVSVHQKKWNRLPNSFGTSKSRPIDGREGVVLCWWAQRSHLLPSKTSSCWCFESLSSELLLNLTLSISQSLQDRSDSKVQLLFLPSQCLRPMMILSWNTLQTTSFHSFIELTSKRNSLQKSKLDYGLYLWEREEMLVLESCSNEALRICFARFKSS